VIGVDLDNVIGDTDEVVRRIIRDLLGVDAGRDEIVTWRYSSSLPITQEQEKQVFDVLHSKYLMAIPSLPGATTVLRHLSGFAPIWIITARPESSRVDTEHWLTSIGLKYDALLFTSTKLDIGVPVLFFIDDNPETAGKLLALSNRVFLMDRPWNRGILETPLLTRVFSWPDVERHAEDIVAAGNGR
jgi:5'(3')-deoxyribonucleotidase